MLYTRNSVGCQKYLVRDRILHHQLIRNQYKPPGLMRQHLVGRHLYKLWSPIKTLNAQAINNVKPR